MFRPLVCAVLVFCSAWVDAESEEEMDAYYGVPLGALHYSADRTKAEMYAADEFTVIFNHFSHSPAYPGCTSIMIGPPRSVDVNAVGSAGVLIPITQPLLTPHTRRARHKRSHPFGLFHGFNWPTEFAHLEMNPKSDAPHQNYKPDDPFAGIELHVESSIDEPVVKEVNIEEVPLDDLSVAKERPVQSSQQEKQLLQVGIPPAKQQATGRAQAVKPVTQVVPELTTVGASTKTSSPPKAKAVYATTQQLLTRATTVLRTTTSKPRSSSIHQETKPIIFFDSKSQTEMEKSREKIETEGPGIVVFNSDRITPRPRSVHPSFYGPLARTKEVESKRPFTSTPSTTAFFPHDVVSENGYIAYFGHSESSTSDWPRRAPSHRSFEDKTDRGGVYDKASYDQKVWVTTTQATGAETGSSSTASTPLFYVIEDPRAERRRLRAERQRKKPISTQSPAAPVFIQYPTTTTPISTRASLKRFERKYELPVAQDKTVAFTLTNGRKLTDYEWIGLYDQCADKATPLISLRGIDPPHEEKIDPLSGWSHNITSYRVQILNCNTILIPGFVFNSTYAPRGTFIYVGIGHFPDAVEKQVKATIVGQPGNELAKNYGLEDVLIRLPKNYRTFDIDFLSIYNEIEQQTYAHVVVPSLLVPPCSEEA
ncbi:hypothetical protein L596_004063 [Steinernema carpocapsae]|uniref:DM13 domain-containing protein n=1 Tax=Steinernema carpocapsae TaxID=34508 RepID=A0A4U8UUQ1_STECR|nr:hypothetical protein L596_004063 [Steinernema carpocapsae]